MPESPPPCPFEKRFPSQLVRDDAFFMSLAYNQAIDAWRVDEVPIGSITNGVHAHSWISPDIDSLFRMSVHGVWDGADDEAAQRRVEDFDEDRAARRFDGRRAVVANGHLNGRDGRLVE